MKYLVLLAFLLSTLGGCGTKNDCIESPDISGISINLEVERLDIRLRQMNSHDELYQFIKNNEVFSEVFLDRSQYPHDSVLVNRFYNLLKDPYIDTLYQETNRVFGNLEDIRQEFTVAFKRLKYYYPAMYIPKIQTVITGLTHDMYVSDSLIIIGLDYYLGEGSRYRPVDIPEYMLMRYQKRNLVPNSLIFYSNHFNRIDPDDKTLLADMIYYGKAYQFAKTMLPCTPDSIFLGYTSREMRDIDRGNQVIWANFIENEVLFETNFFIKDKFISERPKTFEIGQNCPGRIGRWVGWEIVKAYIEKSENNDLQSLMNNGDAGLIFSQSRYKP